MDATQVREVRSRVMVAVAQSRADNDADISRLVAVEPGALDAADRALRPVLNASTAEPGMLPNLYRMRHRNNAERLLIEQTAAGLIDALGDLDDFAFRDSWRLLQQELAAERGPEELEALGLGRELDALTEYVDAAEAVAMIDLSTMDPASEVGADERERILISRQVSEATVHAYESEHAVEGAA